MEGSGGVYGPRGNREVQFYCNVGVTSNKKAEVYAVYQGTQIVKQRHISQLNIVCDSKNTIRYFVTGSDPRDLSLKVLINRIRLNLSSLFVQFFHILQENNTPANEMANKAIEPTPGSLWISGVENIGPSP